MKYRHENFGGIIASEEPPLLAFVDRDYLREIGASESPKWDTPDTSIGQLSAPTEVHVAITNACSNACPHCYMSSGERDADEMDTATFKRAMKTLADMGVFHVALGGGEALERPDLFEISAYCREIGLVPNLTTSGKGMTPDIASQMSVFGQVNLSLDGVGELSGVFRGINQFDQVDAALKMLKDAGVPSGINCVVGRPNYDGLRDLFAYAKQAGLNEIELLRFKPSGRGKELYARMKTTVEQNKALLPMLQELTEQQDLRCRIDCSFVPMLCWHKPPLELLEAFGTYGCEAGNVLMAGRSNGRISGCSFLPDQGSSIFEMPETWTADPDYGTLRRWRDSAPEPCRSCDYVSLCNGGCHAVSLAVTGDLYAPDPDCPAVAAYETASCDRSQPRS